MIEEPREVTDALVVDVGRLVGQLSTSSRPPTRAELEAIVASPATALLIARSGYDGVAGRDNGAGGDGAAGGAGADGAVIGMLTIVIFRIPTGVRAWIEDVVVDRSVRGRGVGEALSRRAIELAIQAGAKTVDLTSRPSREAANRLYRRLGFVARDTNVYRYQEGQS
ncbi:MAG: GNAT family N-acetyltransferase [Actinomycetota bacterium]|nr:GNAT family N-acetyltransferase [Actinomycetota bacterium]MDQ6947865.1 GNAT family N-acetyltransferase [Actinomycetota bacterium]